MQKDNLRKEGIRMLEFNQEEADMFKEEFKEGKWAQKLFDYFYKQNWNNPSKLTAMAEHIYENTGIKVVEPGTSELVVGHYSPSGAHTQTAYKGTPEEHFNWSKYKD